MSPDNYAFTGTLAPTRVSTAYRLGLVVVTAAMLLLPAVYLSLIALAGVLVWWHLTSNTWLLSGRGGGGFWRLLAYLGPAIAGVVLMFFMVKPVFARPAKGRDPLPLRDEDESALFRFIEQICRQVGAPIPGRVQVDCQVNASASFMPGPFGLLRRNLVLTIGMPLAAGLTIRQFGGVLAHEFGHFAQGGGMRLTAIVRGINAWLWRVVHERDAWDDKLEVWSEKGDWRLAIILMLARASIACSRWILKYLMMAGHGISCFMLRQMEYDADSYEVKLAGTPAFAETSARLRELNVGASVGYEDLRNSWLRRTLPSNLPGFLLERTGRLPEELVKKVREIPEQKTGVFDTHPCDVDRVRAAEAAASAGVMSGGDVPATLLFRDFAALSQDATRHHYEHDLGLDLDSATFVTTDDALRESRNREAGMRALEAFFGEALSAFCPIRVSLADLEGSGEAALIEGLRNARDEMARRARMATEYYRQLESIEQKLDNALGAQELIAAGWERVDPTAFELKHGTLDGAKEGAAQATAQLRRLSEVLALVRERRGPPDCLCRQTADDANRHGADESRPRDARKPERTDPTTRQRAERARRRHALVERVAPAEGFRIPAGAQQIVEQDPGWRGRSGSAGRSARSDRAWQGDRRAGCDTGSASGGRPTDADQNARPRGSPPGRRDGCRLARGEPEHGGPWEACVDRARGGGCARQSCRSALTGSRRAARRAGSHVAASATIARRAVTPARVTGSRGLTS